jgi:methylmalonyl-CoA mutase cobalamin-binding domain/chain
MVGVNVFTTEQEKTTPLGVQKVSSNSAKQQVAEVKELKRTRDMDRLNDAIKRLQADVDDVLLIAGGTFPAEDIPAMEEMGIDKVFRAGSLTEPIVDYINDHVEE